MQHLLYNEELALLCGLHKAGVRYLIVGGHAVIAHGHFRPAKNLDIWLLSGNENAGRVAGALHIINLPTPLDLATLLAQPGDHTTLPGWNVELWTQLTGLDFEAAYPRALIMVKQGVQYTVLGFGDLIHNKTALGRLRDLEDIAQLKALPAVPAGSALLH